MTRYNDAGTSETRSDRTAITRRGLIGLTATGAGALAGSALLPGRPGRAQTPEASPEEAATPEAAGGSYVVIADTHTSLEEPQRQIDLERVFAYIAEMDEQPAFLLHVGDVTDTGFIDQWDAYSDLIPDEYRDILYHTPGNHDVRWDPTGGHEYEERTAPHPYSVDVAGLHVVGLDPTDLLQEWGRFHADELQWLEDDLEAVPEDVPIIIFFHYPVGDDNYYNANQDELLEIISRYNVVAIHAGHVHEDSVVEQNGFVQTTALPLRDFPVFHHVEIGEETLNVTSITLGAEDDEEPTVMELVQIPLQRDLSAPGLPEATAESDGEAGAEVTVEAGDLGEGGRVMARIYPSHLYARRDDEDLGWIDLVPDAEDVDAWRNTVTPQQQEFGMQRIELRLEGEDGERWQWAIPVDLTDLSAMPQVWEHEMGAAIQAAIVAGESENGDQEVIATTIAGTVERLLVNADGVSADGQMETEDVIIGAPAMSDEGGIVVGDRSGAVYGFSREGELLDTATLDGPVLGSIAIDGGRILAPAGTSLVALEAATGDTTWSTDIGGFIAGKAATDDTYVYVPSSDGNMYALELSSGDEIWSTAVEENESAHSLVLYSPWASEVTLLPSIGDMPEAVFVASVRHGMALDRESGEVLWMKDGGYMYATPVMLDDGNAWRMVMVDEWGRVSLNDASTGYDLWMHELPYRVLNSSPVVDAEHDRIYVPGVGGQLTVFDLESGTVEERVQLAGTAFYSTPVIVGSTLVAGGMDGVLRGLALDGGAE